MAKYAPLMRVPKMIAKTLSPIAIVTFGIYALNTMMAILTAKREKDLLLMFHDVTAAIAAYFGFAEPVSPQEVNQAGRRMV
jgi:hypothetical protein